MKKIFDTKKKKVITLSILLIIILSLGVSYSLYKNRYSFPNVFQTMTYNVTLEEEFNNAFGTKKVKIINREETNVPVVLRINYNESWTYKVGNETLYLNNYKGVFNCTYKDWTTDFLNDFMLAEDGWYYYKKVLGSNAEVMILNEVGDNQVCNYQNATYDLDFNYEAIQASVEAVKDIWNKEITINAGNVTWNFTSLPFPDENRLITNNGG